MYVCICVSVRIRVEFSHLIVLAPLSFACVQTHQTVHPKYVQFLVYQLNFNKSVIKKKRTKNSKLTVHVNEEEKMELKFTLKF